MSKNIGTMSIGVKCPIIKKGDDIEKIVIDSILKIEKEDNISLKNNDIVAITESVVARAQGNYATIDDIASDIRTKFKNSDEIAVIFPIYSRNRFSIILKGIAKACRKIILMLSYPSDEVGNSLLTYDDLDGKNIDPSSELTLEQYRRLFGYKKHEFTNIDYIEFYKKIIEDENCNVEIIFSNNPTKILSFTHNILTCDIHSRQRTKKILKQNQPDAIVFGLDEILNASVNNSGFNKKYGLLGSNKASETTIKLFPRNSDELVNNIQQKLLQITGKHVEVMIYGDGAFKDPQGKIWELADPVVSPFYTSGLNGTPNELKLKYLADNNFKDLYGDDLNKAVFETIKNKNKIQKDNMISQGTTPRRLTDLLGSLCDLTSGSGDKGTPIVLIKGYFDNFAST
ncbi:MAG: coenzyme F420-0:L-glutamate ligase [Bacilli bacterium]|nr:coenzyme F420-0:L-glutamate ligase [Bacilli bacterium]